MSKTTDTKPTLAEVFEVVINTLPIRDIPNGLRFDFWFSQWKQSHIRDIYVYTEPIFSTTNESHEPLRGICGSDYTPKEQILQIIHALVGIISERNSKTPQETIEAQIALMREKQRQYGDAVLNPYFYCLREHEIPTMVRGLINNKLNRLRNQTDKEDSLADLLGYFCFMWLLS
jgi:hypothetical protein